MKKLKYQQEAIADLTNKTIRQLNTGSHRRKIVFKAPTGAGKTVMACQTLANIIDELKERGDTLYQECAFIWFAPRKLHLQSYASLKGAFNETRKLTPVMFDEVEQSAGIQPGEILFVNWESVNKKNNIIVRDSENSASLYEIARRTQEENHLPIIAVIDEEHMNWSKTADKSAEVLDAINPAVEIRISATPRTMYPDELVNVERRGVIAAEMIKKEVVLNPDIELDFSDERTLNENLIQAALNKRDRIAEAYREVGADINPLLLIQLPNDSSENMTAEDSAIAEAVEQYLGVMCGITAENGQLAIWLANRKENLAGIEKKNSLVKVLLFKEAIALGWDCPRAAVLLIFRKLQSDTFTTQTVGRIMRMPEQKHYTKEILNVGHVYTDIAKDKISIVAADASYILNNVILAKRREALLNVSLPSYYETRPNIGRNYLGPDFRTTLFREAAKFWSQEPGASLFSLAELAELNPAENLLHIPDTDDSRVKENCRRMYAGSHPVKLEVQNVNIPIPKDVHFQNEVQEIQVETMKYARKASEIDRVFLAYISGFGHQFESKGRVDKIASYLLEVLAEFFGVFDTDAKKVVLYNTNKPKFDLLLNRALEEYMKKRQADAAAAARSREFAQTAWEVPEERVYDSETNRIGVAANHAMLPFVQLNEASNPEREFEKFLEENSQYIDWWYKNGDKGKAHYAIPYNPDDGSEGLFYVDFVIRMKNGHVYLFDTKSAGSDVTAPEKHNALVDYCRVNSTDDAPLFGGVIIFHHGNWLFSPLHIDNTEDTHGWDSFYPENS